MPKSLIEAAAASRVVVTTDVTGCRNVIIPNKTGFLVPVKNTKKLADTLEWLIKNPNERVAMGKEGRKFAEKEFPVEKFYRDSKLCTIGEGTTEIQKLVISRNILK